MGFQAGCLGLTRYAASLVMPMAGARKRLRAATSLRGTLPTSVSPRGILVVNKPPNWTSFDVVHKIRSVLERHLRQQETAAAPARANEEEAAVCQRRRRFRLKVGHGGTLDPLATGVLVVAVGAEYTRRLGDLQQGRKQYRATFQLGAATDTQDCTGTVTEQSSFEHLRECGIDDLNRVLQSDTFNGSVLQQVPAYSAVRVQGQRLYQLARSGQTDALNELPTRNVTIFEARCEYFDGQQGTGTLFVDCSGGTYIRTLIHDLGRELGTHAHMTSLVRLRVGPYSLDDAEKPCLRTEEELSDPQRVLSCLRTEDLPSPSLKHVSESA
jgi:tRNA pseudouridine55 synthase